MKEFHECLTGYRWHVDNAKRAHQEMRATTRQGNESFIDMAFAVREVYGESLGADALRLMGELCHFQIWSMLQKMVEKEAVPAMPRLEALAGQMRRRGGFDR